MPEADTSSSNLCALKIEKLKSDMKNKKAKSGSRANQEDMQAAHNLAASLLPVHLTGLFCVLGFPVAQTVENLPAVQETWVPPGLGRSPGEGKGYPFQNSGLENSAIPVILRQTSSTS